MAKTKSYVLSADMIRKLYDSTDDYELREELESQYPELFSKIFEFGEKYAIDIQFHDESPLTIGYGITPNNGEQFSGKCLIVRNQLWNMKQVTQGDMTFIYFEKK